MNSETLNVIDRIIECGNFDLTAVAGTRIDFADVERTIEQMMNFFRDLFPQLFNRNILRRKLGDDTGEFRIPGFVDCISGLCNEIGLIGYSKLEFFCQMNRIGTCNFAFAAKNAIAVIKRNNFLADIRRY